MIELMIAIIILGIGLLITSSMFPIAWFKARDVAEATLVPALADNAHLHVKSLCRANGPASDRNGDSLVNVADVTPPSFYPGDWFSALPSSSSGSAYPDTHVHHLNGGNYLAATGAEVDNDDNAVTDAAWRLEDNLELAWEDTLRGFGLYWSANGGAPFNLPKAQYQVEARMYPALSARPDPDTATTFELQLWSEKFEARRYCWSVFYRFTRMPGPPPENANDAVKINAALGSARRMSMFYVTLKRPVNARYAQQAGYNPNDPSSSVIDPADPQAMTSDNDLLLPTPWRIEATLLIPPLDNVTAGVASEITVPVGSIQADILAEGAALIDDRTGQVFHVAQRRDGSSVTTLTLDKAYRYDKVVYAPEYNPEMSASNPSENWEIDWRWQRLHDGKTCDEWARESIASGDALPPECEAEDEPERRFYWVFPPPVDAVRGPRNRPLFNGAPPVVDVITREVIVAPG